MDLNLSNQKGLIMGGSRGIGYKIAENLSREGATVGIFASRENSLREAAEEIHKQVGYLPLTIKGDATNPRDIELAIEKAYQELGRIDILVNCVGGYSSGTVLDLCDDDFTSLMQKKWLGYLRAMRVVIPIMKAQKGGRILNIAGMSAVNPGYPHAGAVNAAVINTSKVLADEVGRDQILVNCISPGYIQTDHLKHIMTTQAGKDRTSYDSVIQKMTNRIPLGFLGEPQDIADFAVFLVSPRNRYITGTVITIDGGVSRSVF